MDAIRVDGLTKEFGTVTAVNDLSFTVEQGELFGLIGPNGAGKSTLINMLVTLLEPTDGTARVNGHEITEEMPAVRDSLGIVFQEPALDEELTGAENLAFHGRMYGQRKAERDARIPAVLDLVDLADEGDVPVENYSGGMQRRLEIGRGLIHEPEVLFLDEPTVGLDARTRRDTWEYIGRMDEESGVTIILTTHYMEEADFLCDRVGIMDEGNIVALDTPGNLKDSLGGDVVALGIEDAAETFFDRLDGREWVREYTVTDNDVNVTLAHGETRIVDLVRLADEAGVTITSVDLSKPSLENVFLSLTGSTIAERESSMEGDTGDRPNGEQTEKSADERRAAAPEASE